MPALSRAEGVARAILSLHPAPFHVSVVSPAKSNYSRTYGIPRGGGIYRFLCQTNSPQRHLFAVSSSLSSSLTPFTATLTQKVGGAGGWSYQRSSLSAVDCRLLASPPSSPPCSTTYFPLQWNNPFPVITGENQ